MSPVNYYNFETLLKLNDYSAIQTTFGMDQVQANCIERWVGSFTEYHTEQAYANMLTQTIQQSLPPLRGLAYNLAARSTAYYNSIGNYSCEFYFNQTFTNYTQVQDVCKDYDFYSVEGVTYFLNGAWYRDAATKATIMTSTGMSSA